VDLSVRANRRGFSGRHRSPLSKFIALQCQKLNQIKLVGKTNDKYVITFGIARTERSLSIDDSGIF
jgi:hypothetical protein